MRRAALIFSLAAVLQCAARVHYFATDSASVPAGEIVAVEVRAAAGNSRGGQWKIEWPGTEIDFSFSTADMVDGIDQPHAVIKLNGSEFKCPDGIDTTGGANSLAIEWTDSLATVLIGHRSLKAAGTLALPRPTGMVKVTSPSNSFELIDLIIETNPNSFSRLVSDLTATQLAQGKKWEYLDRESDPKIAVAGGQYSLSQIGTQLYYLSGAQTNRQHWTPGMLKGELIPTNFKGYYKLRWFDATGRELPGENYAEIDSDLGTLKLSFPALGASLRFHD